MNQMNQINQTNQIKQINQFVKAKTDISRPDRKVFCARDSMYLCEMNEVNEKRRWQ
jgi:hypothetical protein